MNFPQFHADAVRGRTLMSVRPSKRSQTIHNVASSLTHLPLLRAEHRRSNSTWRHKWKWICVWRIFFFRWAECTYVLYAVTRLMRSRIFVFGVGFIIIIIIIIMLSVWRTSTPFCLDLTQHNKDIISFIMQNGLVFPSNKLSCDESLCHPKCLCPFDRPTCHISQFHFDPNTIPIPFLEVKICIPWMRRNIRAHLNVMCVKL